MEPRISIITLGVSDLERSYKFYHLGLGFPTTKKPEEGIIFFQTGGVCLALYELESLRKDVGEHIGLKKPGFNGVTLAHNTKKEDVDNILELASKSGGKIEKEAGYVFWGGYSGYFSDPDGHLWEVAYADSWKFYPDGRLVIE